MSLEALELVVRTLDDRTLSRFQMTCRAFRELVSNVGEWSVRTDRLVKEYSALIKHRMALTCWRKRCEDKSLLPKTKYDLLKFYRTQILFHDLYKDGKMISASLSWCQKMHRLPSDPARDRWFEERLRKPPRFQTYYAPVKNDYRTSIGENESHVLFSGGVLYVPDEQLDEFGKVYVEDVKRGIPTYYGEKRTGVFVAYMDYDFVDSTILTDDDLFRLTQHIHEVVCEFFPGKGSEHKRVIVSVSQISMSKGLFKMGVHFHWPGLLVKRGMMLNIRFAVIRRLRSVIGKAPNRYTTWEKAIDQGVYDNGLRLFASFKAEDCSFCRKNRKKLKKEGIQSTMCIQCLGIGKIHIDRTYTDVKMVLDESGQIDQDQLIRCRSDLDHLYRCTTLRRPNDRDDSEHFVTPKWVIDIKAEEMAQDIEEMCASDKKRRRLSMRKDLAKEYVSADTNSDYRPVLQHPDFEDRQRTVALVHETIKSNYSYMASAKIKSIKYENVGRYYIVKTDCRWCPNKGDHHATSKIWFRISFETIGVHCFSKVDIVRSHGGKRCRNSVSDRMRTPDLLRQLMFPKRWKERQQIETIYDPPVEQEAPLPPPVTTTKRRTITLDAAWRKPPPSTPLIRSAPPRRRKRKREWGDDDDDDDEELTEQLFGGDDMYFF